MAFPAPHFYLAWSGSLPGGELFTGGLRLQSSFAPATKAEEETALTALRAALVTWWTATDNKLVSSRCQLLTVKLNKVGVDGKYVNGYTNRWDWQSQSPLIVGSTTIGHPNQVALVATLETGLARGLAHRGRIFFPIPALSVGADGLVPSADAQAAATVGARLITNLAAATPGAVPHVYSAGGVDGSAGISRRVTGVSVGRVLDTMRTRRNALSEGRLSAVVPPPA